MLIPLKTPSPQEEGCHANEPQDEKFHFNYNFKCIYTHITKKIRKKIKDRPFIKHNIHYVHMLMCKTKISETGVFFVVTKICKAE